MPYKDPEAQKAFQRRWCAERRAEFFADKTCAWCGSGEELELHHADPNKKVSHAIWSWGRERRLNEIAKCIVLCGACHRGAHAAARRVEAELRHPCGTVQSYKRGCRCDACRNGNRDYARAKEIPGGGAFRVTVRDRLTRVARDYETAAIAADDQAAAGDTVKRDLALAWSIVAITLREIAIAIGETELEERAA